MSDASIYLINRAVYVPSFDGYDFDCDLFPRISAEAMEGMA